MNHEQYQPIEAFRAERRDELIPPQTMAALTGNYERTWGRSGIRSIENANMPETLKRAMWLEENNTTIPYCPDGLLHHIEAVRRSGDIFRMLDVGSGSGAMLFTGTEVPTQISSPTGMRSSTGPPKKSYTALLDDISAAGYKLGKDVQCVAVHAGEFAIEEQPGLQLITANMYEGIPAIEHTRFHCITAIKTVYHASGGLYLIEYFDRLLARKGSQTGGVCFVWPWDHESNLNVFLDSTGREINAETVFALTPSVGYWHNGRHVHWKARPGAPYVRFPVRPFGMCDTVFEGVLLYRVEEEVLEAHQASGGTVVFEQHPRFLDGLPGDGSVTIFS